MKCGMHLDSLLKQLKKERGYISRSEFEQRMKELPEAITTAMRGFPLCLECYLPGLFLVKPEIKP